jgi:hypothetical protein
MAYRMTENGDVWEWGEEGRENIKYIQIKSQSSISVKIRKMCPT